MRRSYFYALKPERKDEFEKKERTEYDDQIVKVLPRQIGESEREAGEIEEVEEFV